MSTTNPPAGAKPGKARGWIGGGLVVAIALSIVLPLIILGVIKFDGNGFKFGAEANLLGNCLHLFDALDPNDQTVVNPKKIDPTTGLNVPGAIGTPVTARDEAGIKAELNERRECGTDGKYDSVPTATHYADFANAVHKDGSPANLTSMKLAYADIDAFAAKISADPVLYASVVEELKTLEAAAAFSIEDVPAGAWSVFIIPDGKGGLTTHIGTTANPGTAAVFTLGDVVIKYRLECGFQILHTTPPPGLPVCEGPECIPPCPPGQDGDVPGVCKDNASHAPNENDGAPTGGGPNADSGPGTYVAPEDNDPLPTDVPTPPAPPAPTPEGTPDPVPPPSVETGAPTTGTPSTGTSCPPGVTSC